MKVSGTSGVGAPSGPARARPAGDGQSFRLPAAEATAAPVQAAPTSGLSGVMGLDALLALQDVGGPLERRKRQVRRAGRLLDVLEDVKLSLLSGELGEADLGRLQAALREQREATDDPMLEHLLNEIETRAAVELAKFERREPR